jgi:phosphoglycolate phosphatase-like HAD superfamily hydrolase
MGGRTPPRRAVTALEELRMTDPFSLTRRGLPALVLASLAARAMAQGAVDPLPSWRVGPRRRALLDFIAAVTTEGDPRYVPPAGRIATFDNDGTLWVEQPMYTQLAFILDRMRTLAPRHPEWRQDPVLHAAATGNLDAVARAGIEGLVKVAGAAQAGTSPEELQEIAAAWLATARHPRWNRPYTELVYQPMLEVLALLAARGFTSFIVSGGGVEFVRAFSEGTYSIPPNRVVGTSFALKPGEAEGRITLTREPRIDFIDDGPGKPVGIARFIGRRPIAAFGNSDGDYEMLRYTTKGPGARLAMIVHHDDAEREYAYDRQSHFGRLDKALDAAPRLGWQVISMRSDWTRIFRA